MTEDEFWVRLEFRVSREFAGLADPVLRSYGCDGFVPEELEQHGDVASHPPAARRPNQPDFHGRGSSSGGVRGGATMRCQSESEHRCPPSSFVRALAPT